MTDESKPKVVEPWMREVAAQIVARYPSERYPFSRAPEHELPLLAEIIASAFARSRPAAPSSDPAPGQEPDVEEIRERAKKIVDEAYEEIFAGIYDHFSGTIPDFAASVLTKHIERAIRDLLEFAQQPTEQKGDE